MKKQLLYKLFKRLSLIALIILIANNAHSQNPANADIIVATDGSGDFTKIQEAINAVPNNSDRRTIIYLKRGLYDTEKLIIPATKKNISIIGESRDETIISYHMYDCSSEISANKCPAESYELWKNNSELVRTSATLTIMAEGFIAENLTIENTAGPVGQALALTIKSDKNIFRNCNIKSYQDTIYLWDSGKRSYFENCLVVGRTDYIYGGGIGYFQACEIRSWGGGWITAPSTPKDQAYGFVFNECKVTYATDSPRNGDDGTPFALGRPWHEYPKVSWLYCEMSEMINPLGWPTKWNMDYADTSADLKLYEYKNTGPGADMSGRANWTGLRAMTDEEALNYTAKEVMKGSDGWDPTAITPAVKSFSWTGNGATKSWKNSQNWNPEGIPSAGESASAEGSASIEADGNTFEADLNIGEGAILDITDNATVTYLAMAGGKLQATASKSLSGKIQIKAETNIHINESGNLDIKAQLLGVQSIIKTGDGIVSLSADNTNYHGVIEIKEGTVTANAANSLGKGNIYIKAAALLIMNTDNSFSPNSVLDIESGGKVELNKPVVLNELYINGTMLDPGVYNSSTHPDVFSGNESITVGRPSTFTWTAAESKTWENPNNYKPAILPSIGDSVIVEVEMETSSLPFEATILLKKNNIRLRNQAECLGGIVMSEGTKITYATSGTGFSMDSHIKIEGNITLQMSGNGEGNSMTMPGTFEGEHKITAYNYTNSPDMVASVILGGDNSRFTGTWDLTKSSRGANSSAAFDGISENAFGNGKIEVSNGNIVIFSHEKAGNSNNELSLAAGTKAIMNTNATVGKLKLANDEYTSGTFNSTTHPAYFAGPGNLIISGVTGISTVKNDNYEITFDGEILNSTEKILSVDIYSTTGMHLLNHKVNDYSYQLNMQNGIYIAKVTFYNKTIYTKLLVKHKY